MGMRFLFALFTLSALLNTLHARPGGYSKPDHIRAMIRARALLGDTKPENSISEPPVAAEKDDGEERENEAEAPSTEPEIGRPHSAGGSVAGGEVIIGGLVTAIFAVVYCYIRVTRRRQNAEK